MKCKDEQTLKKSLNLKLQEQGLNIKYHDIGNDTYACMSIKCRTK